MYGTLIGAVIIGIFDKGLNQAGGTLFAPVYR